MVPPPGGELVGLMVPPPGGALGADTGVLGVELGEVDVDWLGEVIADPGDGRLPPFNLVPRLPFALAGSPLVEQARDSNGKSFHAQVPVSGEACAE
jgi:hypothetical protein